MLICVVLAPNQYCVGYANPDASYPPPKVVVPILMDMGGFYLFINVDVRVSLCLP